MAIAIKVGIATVENGGNMMFNEGVSLLDKINAISLIVLAVLVFIIVCGNLIMAIFPRKDE